ncbi:hypothetical protein [Paenibacillus koleovorans]|uniref:hypothetical protein n=1 Tax=Paenibacillus koleovorans TaxID=121608 RepID=UPI000FDAD9C5|nr:hypothetical protein [Paenibacillus koleovorans]
MELAAEDAHAGEAEMFAVAALARLRYWRGAMPSALNEASNAINRSFPPRQMAKIGARAAVISSILPFYNEGINDKRQNERWRFD